MSLYRATVANSTLIRLEHQDPADPHVLEFHAGSQPLPKWMLAVIQENTHIVASFGFTQLVEGETTTPPAPAADPGAAVTLEGLPSTVEPAPAATAETPAPAPPDPQS